MKIRKLIKSAKDLDTLKEQLLEAKDINYDVWQDFDRDRLSPYFSYSRGDMNRPMSDQESKSFDYFLTIKDDQRHWDRSNRKYAIRNIDEDYLLTQLGYQDVGEDEYQWVLTEQKYPFILLMWFDSERRDSVFNLDRVYMHEFENG